MAPLVLVEAGSQTMAREQPMADEKAAERGGVDPPLPAWCVFRELHGSPVSSGSTFILVQVVVVL